jgi:hypothetical protein
MDNENNRKYVSSRGLLKFTAYHSETPLSSIKKMFNYPNFINFRDYLIKNRLIPTIYVCNRAIPDFNRQYLPKIIFPFILLSGDSDEDMPDSIFSEPSEINNLLNNKYLLKWYCQNWIGGKHPKVTLLPIGLDYHTMQVSSQWGPIMSSQNQEYILEQIKNNGKQFHERELKCYINFLGTLGRRKDRKDAFENINRELVELEKVGVIRTQSWINQTKCAFVVSPHGNGMDCHRTWEALILGCIPIVKKSAIDELYEELPVLIINDWNEITKELLEKTIEDFKHKKFNYEKLTLQYWIKRIHNLK